jgi:hypothetical protein
MNEAALWQHDRMQLDPIWRVKCSPTEKLVLLCIGSHAKRGGGGAFPGIRRISKLTGAAKSTVQNSIATLVGRGYISITSHGNQVAANEYRINIATLMENELDAPELRQGVGLLPAQGVYLPPAQGVPEGVPTRDTGVCRPEAKGGPTTGTEQSTNTEQLLGTGNEGTTLWRAARQNLKATMNPQSWDTWIRPVATAELTDGTLRLNLPTADFETAVSRAPLHAALDKAAETTGISYLNVTLRSPGNPSASTIADINASAALTRSRQQRQPSWRRSA